MARKTVHKEGHQTITQKTGKTPSGKSYATRRVVNHADPPRGSDDSITGYKGDRSTHTTVASAKTGRVSNKYSHNEGGNREMSKNSIRTGKTPKGESYASVLRTKRSGSNVNPVYGTSTTGISGRTKKSTITNKKKTVKSKD